MSDSQVKGKYDDMIELPHHVSYRHARMSRIDRAAQFAPFAALTGYDDAVRETARRTSSRPSLTEDRIAMLDRKLALIAERLEDEPFVSVTYFKADLRKEGGACVTVQGVADAIEEVEGVLVLADGVRIPIRDIVGLESDLFAAEEDD